MTKISDLHRRWSKDADYRGAYDALGEEFDLARTLVGENRSGGTRERPRSGFRGAMVAEALIKMRQEGLALLDARSGRSEA